ncbi:pyridoxamine 5'-phosphate oxidase family protein [Paenibacillus odorifer]|uniref:pyridoxamine 5'-phosphate oxidase family protein n=1 Tax=Paenibacillus odorifer TaxID=189426 RepID=UPI0011154C6D
MPPTPTNVGSAFICGALLKTGYDDPDVILIKVHADAVQYWKNRNLAEKVMQMFKRITNRDSSVGLICCAAGRNKCHA